MNPSRTPRDVKEHFLLAQRLREGPFAEPGWSAALKHHQAEISHLSDAAIDALIADPLRLEQFNRGTWHVGMVNLSHCTVHPKMGGRKWASGTVPMVAIECVKRDDRTDRLWEMAKRNELHRTIPLIVHSRTVKAITGSTTAATGPWPRTSPAQLTPPHSSAICQKSYAIGGERRAVVVLRFSRRKRSASRLSRITIISASVGGAAPSRSRGCNTASVRMPAGSLIVRFLRGGLLP